MLQEDRYCQTDCFAILFLNEENYPNDVNSLSHVNNSKCTKESDFIHTHKKKKKIHKDFVIC